MKKSLLALAAMGAFAGTAHAQSSVTVYGIADVGYNNTTTDSTTTAGVKTSNNLNSTGKYSNYTSSRLGVRGVEDLGKGLRAAFNIEYGFTAGNDAASAAQTGTTITSGTDAAAPITLRQFNVGLAGAFGGLTLGRQNAAVEAAWGAGDVGGANNFIGRAYTFAPAVNASGTDYSASKQNNSRSDRVVTYATPTMSGFGATVQYGQGENQAFTTNNKETEIGATLGYSAGPAQVILGYSSIKRTLNGADLLNGQLTQMVLGANYDFKIAKAFVTLARGSNKTAAGVTKDERDLYELGVSVPVGALVLNASALTGTYTPTENATKGNAVAMQLGVLYNLSKRTMAYGVYGQEKVSGLATTNVFDTVDRKNFGVGVRHTF
jgi:predicted porin